MGEAKQPILQRRLLVRTFDNPVEDWTSPNVHVSNNYFSVVEDHMFVLGDSLFSDTYITARCQS